MNNVETINNKYKSKILALIDGYVVNCFSAISLVEDYYYQDKVKIDIEAREKVTYAEVASYFDLFFDANNLDSFDLVLQKLAAVIKKYRLKSSLEESNTSIELDYDYLESQATEKIYELIGEELPSSNKPLISKIVDNNNIDNPNQEMEGYLNFDRFEELVDLVLRMLPSLKNVADTYGLASVQDVEFSKTRYLALEDCFEKIEFTKKSTPDIGKMCDLLKQSEEEDLNDILSESYARYTLAVLEATHFVANFYTGGKSNRKAAEKHKNESKRINAIQDDIEYYVDLIDFSFGFNFVEAYPRVLDKVNAFDSKAFADKLINDLTKKAKKL